MPTVTERRGSKGLGPETYGPGSAASSTTAGEKPGLFDTITVSQPVFTSVQAANTLEKVLMRLARGTLLVRQIGILF